MKIAAQLGTSSAKQSTSAFMHSCVPQARAALRAMTVKPPTIALLHRGKLLDSGGSLRAAGSPRVSCQAASSIAHALIISSSACGHWLLAGSHFQLPAIVCPTSTLL